MQSYNSAGLPYKVYTALLTQTGTDNPIAHVLQNTLGGTLVWTYDADGLYTATLAGLFNDFDSVFIVGNFFGNDSSSPRNYIASTQAPDSISLQIMDDNGTLMPLMGDEGANLRCPIEIRVYN